MMIVTEQLIGRNQGMNGIDLDLVLDPAIEVMITVSEAKVEEGARMKLDL